MHSIFVYLQYKHPQHTTHNPMATTTSTLLYDKACVAAEKARALRDKANETRFNAARLSVPDELHWYNNNTNWNALSRKEFRDVMIRMESITAQHYEDFGADHYRSAAIRKFWADEWDCEYLPETGQWFDLVSNNVFHSQTEKAQSKAQSKAKKAEKKALGKAKKALEKAKKAKALENQYNDEEEELYRQALAAKVKKEKEEDKEEEDDELYVQTEMALLEQQQQPHDYDYYDWCYDEAEEAYAEAYAKARAAEELKEQQEQQEAEAYLAQHATRVTCQPVFYFEELTHVKGDPDWRAYIYYDERIRRYVFKGTRRSVLNYNKKKTMYPEVKLCFRSSRELASFLCSSTDNTMNITMFAMASATVRDATFAELSALPARGNKTELFGYDQTRPRYSTFVNYLRTLRDVDVSHSTFASF
jgi:hypothetical protein